MRPGACAGVAPRSAARNLVAILDGLQIQWLYADERFDMSAEVLDYLDGVLAEPIERVAEGVQSSDPT